MNRKVLWVIIVGSLLLGWGGVFKYHSTKVQQRVRVEELVVLLSNDDVDVRLKATKALSCMRSAALEPAVPALLGALSDEHPGIRSLAVSILWRIGSFGKPEDTAVTTLVEYLDNQVPEARINGARALGRLGWRAEPAIPALTAARRHEDADMRAAAQYALSTIEASVQARITQNQNRRGATVKTRNCARMIVISPDREILMVKYETNESINPARPDLLTYWVTPGGGVDNGEGFEETAKRELEEETGIDVTGVCPWVWSREERLYDPNDWSELALYHERYFVTWLEVKPSTLRNRTCDEPIVALRWWSTDEMRSSEEVFLPPGFPDLVEPILSGEVPSMPVMLEVSGDGKE